MLHHAHTSRLDSDDVTLLDPPPTRKEILESNNYIRRQCQVAQTTANDLRLGKASLKIEIKNSKLEVEALKGRLHDQGHEASGCRVEMDRLEYRVEDFATKLKYANTGLEAMRAHNANLAAIHHNSFALLQRDHCNLQREFRIPMRNSYDVMSPRTIAAIVATVDEPSAHIPYKLDVRIYQKTLKGFEHVAMHNLNSRINTEVEIVRLANDNAQLREGYNKLCVKRDIDDGVFVGVEGGKMWIEATTDIIRCWINGLVKKRAKDAAMDAAGEERDDDDEIPEMRCYVWPMGAEEAARAAMNV